MDLKVSKSTGKYENYICQKTIYTSLYYNIICSLFTVLSNYAST